MAYRDFSYPQVKDKLGLSIQDADLSAGAGPFFVREEFTAFVDEGLAIAVADLGVSSEKAKSEFIVAPMLVELRRSTGRRFSVFSGMELNVNKARGLNGSCDFILTKGENQHLRAAPIVGILEAKNEDNSQRGLGQCIAGMYGAQLRNQKHGWAISHVFGAITTGRTWKFLHMQGSSVTMDRTPHRINDLPKVMGILHHLIEFSMQSGESASVAVQLQCSEIGSTSLLH